MTWTIISPRLDDDELAQTTATLSPCRSEGPKSLACLSNWARSDYFSLFLLFRAAPNGAISERDLSGDIIIRNRGLIVHAKQSTKDYPCLIKQARIEKEVHTSRYDHNPSASSLRCAAAADKMPCNLTFRALVCLTCSCNDLRKLKRWGSAGISRHHVDLHCSLDSVLKLQRSFFPTLLLSLDFFIRSLESLLKLLDAIFPFTGRIRMLAFLLGDLLMHRRQLIR